MRRLQAIATRKDEAMKHERTSRDRRGIKDRIDYESRSHTGQFLGDGIRASAVSDAKFISHR